MFSLVLLLVFVPAFAKSPYSHHDGASCLEEGRFRCHLSGRCLEMSLVCNGHDDCGDTSDEKDCSAKCSQDALVACAYPTSVEEIKFATKREDLDKLCPHLHSGLRCIDNYTRNCLQPEQRSHFNNLYAGTSMVIQEICSAGHYQEEFLRHAPCMNRLTDEYEHCVNKYQTQLNNLTKEVQEASEGLKKICGNLHDLLSCSKNIVKETCGEETAIFAAGFLDRMADSLIRIHCAEMQVGASGASRIESYFFFFVLILPLAYLFT